MKYGYIRVSTVKQADEGTSPESQRQALIAAGVREADIVVDNGVSGSIPLRDRPQGGILLQALKKGDCMVVTKLDRAFRSVEDCARSIAEFDKRGIDIIILSLGIEPVGKSAMASFMLKMFALVGEFERAMIAERTAEGKKQRHAAGFFMGGKPPFGFQITATSTLVEEDWRAEAVATMRELRREGKSLRAISDAVSLRFGQRPALTTIKRLAESKEDINDLV